MKYFLFVSLLIIGNFLYANILIEGPYANELMWIDGEWYLELENCSVEPHTLEWCYIYNISSFSYFNDVYFPPGGATVVTKDSLANPFDFDLQTDYITLGWEGSSWGSSCILQYGNESYSMPPLPGESIVRQYFVASWGQVLAIEYCRDNTPTLGEFNDNSGFTGFFTGTVVNAEGSPLAGAVIEYFPWNEENQIITDLAGEFNKEMYTIRYDIQVIFEDITYTNTTIRIAPDSTTVRDIILPISESEPSLAILKNSRLSNFPNPFNPSTTIQFSIPMPIETVRIDIFNNKGQKINTLSCNNVEANEQAHVIWNGNNAAGKQVASGVYFARLVGDGLLLKECKMLLLK